MQSWQMLDPTPITKPKRVGGGTCNTYTYIRCIMECLALRRTMVWFSFLALLNASSLRPLSEQHHLSYIFRSLHLVYRLSIILPVGIAYRVLQQASINNVIPTSG
jgi:hypothetical protein